MRNILLASVAAIPLSIAIACVGSDPDPVTLEKDSGTGATSSGATSSGSTSSSSSGGPPVEAGPPPELCTKIQVTTLAGNGAALATDGPGKDASFNVPIGIALKDSGLVVADSYSGKVRYVSLPLGEVSTYASNLGQPARLGNSSANGIYVASTSGSQLFRVTALNTFKTPGLVHSGITTAGVAPDNRVFMAGGNCGIWVCLRRST